MPTEEEYQQQQRDSLEIYGVKACEFCGENLRPPRDEVGEFYDPSTDDMVLVEMGLPAHKIGHAQCGLDAKWELA